MALKIQHEELPGLNLTPMIDVVFLLIIFFMVGSKFGDMERSINLDVPQVGAASTMITPPQKRVINLFQDGRLLLDNAPVTLPQLTETLRRAHQQYPDLGVLVRGDANSSLQNVAGILSACREAGLAEMGIAVRVGNTEIR